MRALLILAAIFVTVLGTTGCSGKQREPIVMRKSFVFKRGQTDGKGVDGEPGVQKASAAKGCFQVGELLAQLRGADDTATVVHTSNLQVGTFDNQKSGIFNGQFDEAMSVGYFLRGGVRPVVQTLMASELGASAIGKWINAKVDKDCKKITVTGPDGAVREYDVRAKGGDYIFGEGEEGHAVRFSSEKEGQLTIQEFAPTKSGEICGREVPPVELREHIVGWSEAGLGRLLVHRDLAGLFVRYLNEAKELKKALEKKAGNYVSVSLPGYMVTLTALEGQSFDNLRCADLKSQAERKPKLSD